MYVRNRTLYIVSRISHINLLTEEIILQLGIVAIVVGELEMPNLLKLRYVLIE